MPIVTELIEQAQRYCDLGWRVVLLHGLKPDRGCTCKEGANCVYPAKHPRLKPWQDHATCDVDEIERQLTQKPNSNIGIQLGPNSKVIDIEYDSEQGKATIARLLPEGIFTPSYRSHRSIHRLFQCPMDLPPIQATTIEGVEFRFGTNDKATQSVMPPSRHASGLQYEWLPGLSPEDVSAQPLPKALRELLLSHVASPGGPLEFVMADDSETLATHPGAPEGERNATLCRLVGSHLRQHGIDESLLPIAYEWGERCSPPMPADRITKTVENLAAKEMAKRTPGAVPTNGQAKAKGVQPPPAPSISLVPLSSIAPQKVEWVWPLRIPRGKLSILGGDGGAGKTTLACDIASRLSRGEALPEGSPGEPIESLIVSAEDGNSDTIRTRIEAMEGDLGRVYVLDSESDVTDFRRSIEALQMAITSRPKLRIVFFDTLPDFVGQADDYKNSELRQALKPLIKLAAATGIAMVGICHFGKAAGVKSSSRLLGSVAYINMSRSVMYVAHDKDRPGRRILWHEKSNLGPMANSLAFTLQQDGDDPFAPARIAWEREPVFIDDIGKYLDQGGSRPKSKQQQAEAWITRFLAGGSRSATEVTQAAELEGITHSVLYRAADAIGVVRSHREWLLPQAIDELASTTKWTF